MKLSIMLLAILLVFCVAPIVDAHSAEEEGEITVLMHAEPEDRPLANQSTILHFQITDESKGFIMSDCKCVVTIQKDGKVIQKKTVENLENEKSIYNAFVTVNFSDEGNYNVEFSGNPKSESSFHPFTAKFDLKVGKAIVKPVNKLGIPNYVTYLTIALIGATSIGLIFRQVKAKKD